MLFRRRYFPELNSWQMLKPLSGLGCVIYTVPQAVYFYNYWHHSPAVIFDPFNCFVLSRTCTLLSNGSSEHLWRYVLIMYLFAMIISHIESLGRTSSPTLLLFGFTSVHYEVSLYIQESYRSFVYRMDIYH